MLAWNIPCRWMQLDLHWISRDWGLVSSLANGFCWKTSVKRWILHWNLWGSPHFIQLRRWQCLGLHSDSTVVACLNRQFRGTSYMWEERPGFPDIYLSSNPLIPLIMNPGCISSASDAFRVLQCQVLQQQKIRDGTSFVIKLGDKNVPWPKSSVTVRRMWVRLKIGDRGICPNLWPLKTWGNW